MFRENNVFPGIFHITDAMGVSFTLIEGKNEAFLFDAGYGTENVRSFVRNMTDKPIKVFLSHGHHDHVLGSRWFDRTHLCREDMEEFRARTGRDQRMKVAKQAMEKGVMLPEDFMVASVPLPEPIIFTEQTAGFDSETEDLGCLKIRIIRVPGHTPGSIVVYVPEFSLLLTGDNWNPCTWMWFPNSINAFEWRENMRRVISALEDETKTGISQVLCSHQANVRSGTEIKKYLEYMTFERMSTAPAVEMGSPIHTHQIVHDEWTLVFDRSKIRKE